MATAVTEYISACCNCTYNCLEITSDIIIYGANRSLAVYDIKEFKTVTTHVAHNGRINCVRFLKNSNRAKVVTCCAQGSLILWEASPSTTSVPQFQPKHSKEHPGVSLTVADGISVSEDLTLIGCLTSDSRVLIYKLGKDSQLELLQTIHHKKSIALELVFHQLSACDKFSSETVMGLGMENGSVSLYALCSGPSESLEFILTTSLLKHEDWVRCLRFVTLDNGDTLLASGGQDSCIAVWKFTKLESNTSEFEFQVHRFKDHLVLFDSMIIGHEGWINSLDWSDAGDLISCSSDQSTIIWTYADEIWVEKARFGVMGGQIPGGYGAKLLNNLVVSYGFQGGIQIWLEEDNQWNVQPSVTGHFSAVSDMDYDLKGNYIITTSHDQTTRIHAPWGPGRWHEIARPQIHGHDLFCVRPVQQMIVSGAEEKILRAFQPPDIFFRCLEDISDISIEHKSDAKAAGIPALGLSNQSEETSVYENALELPVEVKLDEDFLRSQTLWPEVSKLYGHVYEISCIGTSPVDLLIASGSQSSKPQFSSIILWCASRWKNLGEFPFHKLNVTGLEFRPDGKKLLSVSRDRTWAVWNVNKETSSEHPMFKMEVLQSENFHTRALWVGTWSPCGKFFVTGGRDKKLAVWMENNDGRYEMKATRSFSSSVSAAAINEDDMIVVGLESGVIEILQYHKEKTNENEKLASLVLMDESKAHHDVIKRLRFNPQEKYQFASVSADHIVKVHEIRVAS